MEENLMQQWGADYDASQYFKSLGLKNVSFEWKQGKGNAAGVLFITVHGIRPFDGQFVDIDIWPAYDFESARVAELVKASPVDFVLRRGRYVDPDTGETSPWSMKWLTTNMDRTPLDGAKKRPGYAETHAV